MKLNDVDRVLDLRHNLEVAEKVLDTFERAPGPTVPVFAHTDESMRSVQVELLPVEKGVAVSAARRQRDKIIDDLRQLGVEVR